jgi:hypothetical protein
MQVSAGTRGSVDAAYQADQADAQPTIGTSYQAVYAKRGRLQPAVSAAVGRPRAQRGGQLRALLPPARAEPVPGYRLRILDGTGLTGTEHRWTPLRHWLQACLPGKSLVVYEPGLGLVTDVVLCEDAYTPERALVTQLIPRVQAQELFVADRNFCTPRFVFGVIRQEAFVLVRHHRRNLPCQPLSPLKKCGQTDTGVVDEQRVQVTAAESGTSRSLRRIEVRLFPKTRDGDRTIAVLTNLPDQIAARPLADV